MSVHRIIQESIEKNPLGLKEAFAEELSNRIRLALEAKMNDEDDEDEEDGDLDEEVEQLDELSPGVLQNYMRRSAGTDDYKDKSVASDRRLKAQSKAHRTLGNDKEADRLKNKAKKRDSYFAKAMVRHDAQQGKLNLARTDSTSPYAKAAKTMPASYNKEGYESFNIDED